MRNLPRSAQKILWINYILGAAIALRAVVYNAVTPPKIDVELIVYAVFAVLAGSRKVSLMRHKTLADVGSMSLAFVLTFAAMLRFGPQLAIFIGGLSVLSGCLYPKRHPFHQLLFNVFVNTISTGCSGQLYLWINGGQAVTGIEAAPAITAACLAFYLVNTGFVSLILGAVLGQQTTKVWQEKFLWTAPSYFVGALTATLAAVLQQRYLLIVISCGIPVGYLTFRSYKIYSDQAEQMLRGKEELADLYLATIKSLALAIDAKDAYTHQHILRVQHYAMAIARQLGLTGAELEGVNTGALLHDIGKLGVPEYVLLKPGKLTPEEFDKIKQHPRIGADILADIPFPWPVLPGVKYHHEKWNGMGYPEGLKGEEIPFQARILAVADVYDALTSNRSYRGAWEHSRAVKTIREDSGIHFDPVVVEAFLAVIDGVVEEMASRGEGPLAPKTKQVAVETSHTQRAVRDIQRASSELWALYEVAQTLSSSIGLEETLDILARKLEAIIPNVGCVFLMRESEGSLFEVRAAVGINREFFLKARTSSETSLSQQVALTGKTYCGEYERDDILVQSSPGAQWIELGSMMVVPIIHQAQTLGTINLYHPDAHAFSTHDQHLLETIAARAALALYNGLLFERTRNHAHTDPLTGLYNIRYVTQTVEELCERASSQERFSLICVDLDSFKPINDLYGHQEGDRVLRDLAELLREAVAESDIVARYGGDEFLIVCQGAPSRQVERLAQKIRETVQGYQTCLLHPKLGQLRLGASVGVATFPDDGSDWPSLLSVADQQMYQDKAERKLGRLIETEPGRVLAEAA
ncbi:sensor domain-containing diguanylate cyclase/phosphohydrolase [Armatimonas rosea]|uniref:Diguanylate cyclase (GGDEF)-like protein/putative nucleotidyltransferase with HDIG domain n=1 Tax=Armatimonas rosea TaxID=685828 RepID=A0A7W9SPJ2_ARMRO|nr:diguanylate cyclase [Armatimonas rosea]MBB6049678.1 diguanylate cyclase (GGDEF)-like protein/putative nucleotidyltransferase with HDIG domain [Armatimonas rosea]